MAYSALRRKSCRPAKAAAAAKDRSANADGKSPQRRKRYTRLRRFEAAPTPGGAATASPARADALKCIGKGA
ncbi:MAG TPA: hypothetical protein VEN78_34185 [Bradyrhizobium sp.]|nr:hypothetical protein [Bradyrhizobium sp.]